MTKKEWICGGMHQHHSKKTKSPMTKSPTTGHSVQQSVCEGTIEAISISRTSGMPVPKSVSPSVGKSVSRSVGRWIGT